MVYYDPRKPKPWPIRFLNKFGVVNDNTANKIVLWGALLLLIVTIILYLSIFGDNTEEIKKVDREILRQMGELN